MEGIESVGWFSAFLSWIAEKVSGLLTVQNAISVLTGSYAIYKGWEAREANLYLRFERMISKYEHQLLRARTDLIEVMTRPGPGVLIRTPLFLTWKLRAVLSRHRWHPASLWPLGQRVDRRLAKALLTCNRKVSAHIGRLSYFREQVASAKLIQGSLAAARAANCGELHERQRLDAEALDHFRSVLAIPGHQDDLGALELISHQLARIDPQSELAISSYTRMIEVLEQQPASPNRNRTLARAKRGLAIVVYARRPGIAQGLLAHSIELLTELGPPPDRDFHELAQTYYLDGIARLRLGQTVQGPQQLSLAQGCYRELIRSLEARRPGLFRWMFRERRFIGHRVSELRAQAEWGLLQVNHFISLNGKRQNLLIASLQRGSGVPRRNRTPLSKPQRRWLSLRRV